MLGRAKKVSDIIVELGAEISDLNAQIDAVKGEIRTNAALPASREEIEEVLRAKIDQGAARYKEALRFEFRSPFSEKDGRRTIHDGLSIMRLTDLNSWTPGTPIVQNLQLLQDGFAWLVKHLGKPAIDDLMQSAPSGGVPTSEKEANEEKLKAKKRALETQLEEVYCEAERCGMTPERRPDLDPWVFLEFGSRGRWENKFESLRRVMIGERANRSKIQEKRNDLIFEITRRRNEIAKYETGDITKRLEREIADLREEEKGVAATLNEMNEAARRRGKFFNNCLTFLKEQGCKVDDHV